MRALVDQVGDAVREHPRLAGSGTGDDEQRTVAVHDRVELIGVETGHVAVGGGRIRDRVRRPRTTLTGTCAASHGHPTNGVRQLGWTRAGRACAARQGTDGELEFRGVERRIAEPCAADKSIA